MNDKTDCYTSEYLKDQIIQAYKQFIKSGYNRDYLTGIPIIDSCILDHCNINRPLLGIEKRY